MLNNGTSIMGPACTVVFILKTYDKVFVCCGNNWLSGSDFPRGSDGTRLLQENATKCYIDMDMQVCNLGWHHRYMYLKLNLRLGSHHVEKWCLGNIDKFTTPHTNMKEYIVVLRLNSRSTQLELQGKNLDESDKCKWSKFSLKGIQAINGKYVRILELFGHVVVT